MRLERLSGVQPDAVDFRFEVRRGDAFMTIRSERSMIEEFTPLTVTRGRKPHLIPDTTTLHLPPGSSIAAIVDEKEILVKHLLKKKDKKFGLLAVFYGGRIEAGTNGGGGYRMRNGTKCFLGRQEFEARVRSVWIRGKFLI